MLRHWLGDIGGVGRQASVPRALADDCSSVPVKSCYSAIKTLGFLAWGGEEFNLGPVTKLVRSELLCNQVLLKYKRDRESL